MTPSCASDFSVGVFLDPRCKQGADSETNHRQWVGLSLKSSDVQRELWVWENLPPKTGIEAVQILCFDEWAHWSLSLQRNSAHGWHDETPMWTLTMLEGLHKLTANHSGDLKPDKQLKNVHIMNFHCASMWFSLYFQKSNCRVTALQKKCFFPPQYVIIYHLQNDSTADFTLPVHKPPAHPPFRASLNDYPLLI